MKACPVCRYFRCRCNWQPVSAPERQQIQATSPELPPAFEAPALLGDPLWVTIRHYGPSRGHAHGRKNRRRTPRSVQALRIVADSIGFTRAMFFGERK